ncbi:hypothetical protein QMK19_40925 [Streptomyces sp. H10-C2]|uniref:hypothetical protein n=1 Tax=unclassified Streptomyces TaxID=2593676 RepID=UPI0024BA7E20|nr:MULTISPECIES: hypothetical protein [unclassified Streptomyces]MDJ0375765.1 hypothetical protein [Streptomyces sp. H10-C2]
MQFLVVLALLVLGCLIASASPGSAGSASQRVKDISAAAAPAGSGIGIAAFHRYIREAIEFLATEEISMTALRCLA